MKTYKVPTVQVHKVHIEQSLLTQSWNPGQGSGGYTHPEKPGHNKHDYENEPQTI